MNPKAGVQIGRKAFLQSVTILFILMLIAGALTLAIPAGQYTRQSLDGRELVVADSFQFTERPNYPVWRWFTAPLEVLAGPNSLTLIVIILFILMVGGAFAVLDHCGILKIGLAGIVARFGGRKYTLLLIITFFFMALGAFFGIFEEVVPLVPLMLALSYYLGWDALVGLGMSIFATNMGFSAAITNPFTIGVAQKLAGLPLFSGAWFRIPIFLVFYALLAIFLVRYARHVERDPQQSPVYQEGRAERAKYQDFRLDDSPARIKGAAIWFGVSVGLILILLIGSPFVPGLSDYALPAVGLLFLIGGLGAGILAGSGKKAVFSALGQGIAGIAPGILLILMAASVNHIVVSGGVMDTILHSTSTVFSGLGPFSAAILIYLLALLIEIFISSASAKAFLLMPILLPLADLVGVTRQVAVTAYCFGDGFSNLAYPTNPVLLIVLGLTVVSYPKWLRWTLKLWVWVILLSLVFLGLGVALHLGPF